MRRVVVGGPVANRAWVLPYWFAAMARQEVDDCEVVYLFATTPSVDGTDEVLEAHGAYAFQVDGQDHTRSDDEQFRHLWVPQHYEMMCELRNVWSWAAYNMDCTYALSLDSDILLPRYGLARLMASMPSSGKGAVAPLVDLMVPDGVEPHVPAWNWTKGNWDRHILFSRITRVDTIMAAKLMGHDVLAVKWAPHGAGEDFGWSQNAREAGVEMYVNPRVVCRHIMRPNQLAVEELPC